jgi:hypothetical protein
VESTKIVCSEVGTDSIFNKGKDGQDASQLREIEGDHADSEFGYYFVERGAAVNVLGMERLSFIPLECIHLNGS